MQPLPRREGSDLADRSAATGGGRTTARRDAAPSCVGSRRRPPCGRRRARAACRRGTAGPDRGEDRRAQADNPAEAGRSGLRHGAPYHADPGMARSASFVRPPPGAAVAGFAAPTGCPARPGPRPMGEWVSAARTPSASIPAMDTDGRPRFRDGGPSATAHEATDCASRAIAHGSRPWRALCSMDRARRRRIGEAAKGRGLEPVGSWKSVSRRRRRARRTDVARGAGRVANAAGGTDVRGDVRTARRTPDPAARPVGGERGSRRRWPRPRSRRTGPAVR